MSSTAPSSTATSSSSRSVAIPTPARHSLRADERRVNLVLWRRIGHQNLYRNTEPSPVWLHGDIYMRPTKPREPPHFICDYCDSALKTQPSRSTTNFRRHLRDAHKIVFDIVGERTEEEEEEVIEAVIAREGTPQQYSALCTTINMD